MVVQGLHLKQLFSMPVFLGIGLAETSNIKTKPVRSRVKLETDGKLLTGKDVAYACALGAEEFGLQLH